MMFRFMVFPLRSLGHGCFGENPDVHILAAARLVEMHGEHVLAGFECDDDEGKGLHAVDFMLVCGADSGRVVQIAGPPTRAFARAIPKWIQVRMPKLPTGTHVVMSPDQVT